MNALKPKDDLMNVYRGCLTMINTIKKYNRWEEIHINVIAGEKTIHQNVMQNGILVIKKKSDIL
jgi:hypothetical protein